MAMEGSSSCPQCGAPVGTTGGRCPLCGVMLVAAPPTPEAQRPTSGLALGEGIPRAITERAVPRSSDAATVGHRSSAPSQGPRRAATRARATPKGPILGLVASLAVTGLLAYRLLGPSAHPAPPALPRAVAAPTAHTDAIALVDPTKADPSEQLARARKLATAWCADARLLSIVAAPVVEKRVDFAAPDAHITFTWTAVQRDGSTAPSQGGGRLALRFGSGEPTSTQSPAPSSDDRAALDEPSCASLHAMRAVRGSGVPGDQRVELRYERDAQLARAVWVATVAGHKEWERVVDGASCAIVTRHPVN